VASVQSLTCLVDQGELVACERSSFIRVGEAHHTESHSVLCARTNSKEKIPRNPFAALGLVRTDKDQGAGEETVECTLFSVQSEVVLEDSVVVLLQKGEEIDIVLFARLKGQA